MMGDGSIDLRGLGAAVEAAGYRGDIEVEIFNQDLWDADPASVLDLVIRRFAEHVLDPAPNAPPEHPPDPARHSAPVVDPGPGR
jgi:sugar phosphate isomerase/epimerase